MDVCFFPDFRTLYLTESHDLFLPWRNFWLKRIKELEKLIEYKNILSEFIHKTEPFLNPYRDTVSQIEKKFDALHCLTNDLVENIKEDYLAPAKVRGATSDPLNILFFVWSHFIKDKDNNEVHIQTILSLLRWVSTRIGDYYFKEEDIDDDKLKKELYRYRHNELKLPKKKADRYKERFLIPKKNIWPEKSFGKKTKPNIPLIIFSNGERLTIRDYLNNKSSSHLFPSSEKCNLPPLICLDFKSLSSYGDSWRWLVELMKILDELE